MSYVLGVEAVKEPFGPRLGAPVSLAVRLQRKQSMTWVTGVSDNFMGFPLTPPIIQVLDGRTLGPSDVLGRMHYPLQRLTVRCRAVAIPDCDATGQDTLDGAAVESFEDLGTMQLLFCYYMLSQKTK